MYRSSNISYFIMFKQQNEAIFVVKQTHYTIVEFVSYFERIIDD